MDPSPASPDPSPLSPAAKRSAWKQPSSNGFFLDAPPPGVMDADHWPALSDAAKTKAAPSSDPPKPPPDSSSAAATVASSAVANPSNSPKHGSGAHHGRQKPARRGGGDHSPRDHHGRGTGGWDHGTGGAGGRGGQRSHNNGGSGRRGGGNSGSGGGVAHHGGFGGRRRGGFEGFYRGPSMGIGPYMRGAPPPPPPLAVPPPFMGPPPPPVSHMRAFAGPMLFHEMPSPVSPVSPMYYVGPPPPPEALRGLAFATPMVGPPAYPYFQPPAEPDADAEDHAKLLKQIEFYFSKDNLCTDVFLRRNMDEEGWVDISLIAGFNKVQAITANLQYIKETIQSSSILEMQGDKIRRQNDWDKWVIPRESNPDIPTSSAAVPSPNVNDLTAHLGGVGLHEIASSSSTMDQNHHEVLLNGSTSTNNQGSVVADNASHREP